MEVDNSVNRPATISALDAGVGEIVASLKRSGLWENSVLLFSTDNGGPVPASSNLPLRGTKAMFSTTIGRAPTKLGY